MNNKINVLKQCAKDNNLSPQLNNFEFTKDNITVYNDGNIIQTKNDVGVTGYVDSKSLVKAVSKFKNAEIVDTSTSLIVKEGRNKMTIKKYELSGGEEPFDIPKSQDEKVLKINKNFIDVIKLVSYSSIGSSLNMSGDGIIVDMTGKFKKMIATNGDTMSIGNLLLKGSGKVFIPKFIIDNMIKYFTDDSYLYYSPEYVRYDNGEYQFTTLYTETEEQTDINSIIKSIEIKQIDIELTDDFKSIINNVIDITDNFVELDFKSNRVDINGYCNNSCIESSFDINNNQCECKIKLDKKFLKHGMEFDKFDLCYHVESEVYLIKFKKSKVNYYISPASGG